MKVKTVLLSSNVHIDTASIPTHVAHGIAQAALQGIQKAYADPAFQEGYQKWKEERNGKTD